MIKKFSQIEYYLDCCDPKAIRFHGLDDAIIGVDHSGQLCYLHSKMVELFMSNDDMTEIEAMEWIDYNVIGTNAGVGFTVIFDD
tara:strand:+ start:327 stop:578 length:252 start_codon:yes stop_codon:yes gene_type:complete